ncbi:hypothetical protein PanWU01x14_199000 [Parasponia andersonii]|uniref:Uncharacterized protein n=1 Tax=Parasponia andersonii TaxID=3476 RepID=A0A2P5BYL8_PARAD|nr:hypothetical protein PanWU01x14_199000 [Parasponia andersonii]
MDAKSVFGVRENEGKWDFLGIWSVQESRLLLASLLPLVGFSISGEADEKEKKGTEEREGRECIYRGELLGKSRRPHGVFLVKQCVWI